MNLTGMRAFVVVWIGQFLSRVGSFVTGFALAIWAFDQTNLATTLTTITFLAWGSSIIAGPFTGVLVDRWNRKLTMMISDLAAAATTVGLLVLYLTGNLEIWHLWVQAVILGAADSFQWPAFSAAISTMLNKDDYGRAYGLSGIAENSTIIFGPPLAAAALTVVSLETIMVIDLATFVFAIGAILLVTIPAAQVSVEGKASREGSFRNELTFGWRYIVSRPTLLGLQLIILAYATLSSLGGSELATPMILARTDGDTAALGITQMAFGLGGVTVGALLGAKGTPRNRPSGLFLGIFGQCLGLAVMGMGRSTAVWMAGAFCASFSVGIALASNQAYWQSKVPPDIQGKVFAMRRMIAQIAGPISVLIAGPLADRVFEPAAARTGSWSNWLVGSGPGAGMGLQMVIFGTAGALAGLCGYLFKATREAETLLPDHTQDYPVKKVSRT
jgi:MFS transporter, DHA3 family, macrolide efflux protein